MKLTTLWCNQNNSQAPLLEYEGKCKKARKKKCSFKSPQRNYRYEKFIRMKWQWKQSSYAPASFCGTAFIRSIQPSRLTCSSKNEKKKMVATNCQEKSHRSLWACNDGHHVRSKPDICFAPSISCTFNLNIQS